MHCTRLYLIVIFVLAGLVACNPSPETTSPTLRLSDVEQAEQDSALTQLSNLNRHAIDRAFAHLPQLQYLHTQQFEQFDVQGDPMAYRRTSVQYRGSLTARTAEQTQVDTRGNFSTSFWGKQTDLLREDTTSLARLILPLEPAYLSPRGQETYHYQILSDSVLDGLEVHRIEVKARPGLGDQQPLRRVLLYFETTSDEVIGIHVERVQSSMLYDERSSFYLQLQAGPVANWLPHHVRLETRTQALFFDPLHYRRVSTYSDFQNR